jgi:tripartite-type tricarboxylate transporter receptor subunit TctC
MILPRRRFLHLAAASAVLPAATRFALADTYPSRPIHLIVGFTPGAASDVTGRIFAKEAEPFLGQQIVVENKPGAGSSIAAEYVARADKDGYTLLIAPLSTLTDELASERPIRLDKDFAPVALLGELATVLVVSPLSGLRSVAELVALCKSKPGQVLYGSVGAGTQPQLCAVLFAQRTGIDIVHVPYPGSPQAVTDTIANRITLFFAPGSAIMGQVGAGKLTALAVASDKRAKALPNVPTLAEAGVPDFNTPLWLGLAAPKDTPRPIVDQLATAANKAMHTPEAVDTLVKQCGEPLQAGPDQFAAFIQSEAKRWAEVARLAKQKS